MGVTVSRSEGETVRKSKPLQDFKRVSTRVGKIGVIARQAQMKNRVQRGVWTESDDTATNSCPQTDSQLRTPDLRRPSIPQFYDGSEKQHTFVYKDTSGAWAALRAGLLLGNIAEIPDTEISVVDSTLEGYKTVEKTRNASGIHNASETELDSGNDSFTDTNREQNVQEGAFSLPFGDGVEPAGWREQISSTSKCALCESCTGHDMYPCRICNQVFHEDCLRRRGKLHDKDAVKALRAANSNIGWSCHDCENLGQLLSDDDMFELMEAFERCDVDSDATISVEEFVQYRQLIVKDHEDRQLTQEETEYEIQRFIAMDTDGTGTLSWWEFLNHEAIRRLATRSKKSLVMLLKPKEIQRIRSDFALFDTDGDGCVTEYEARRAFNNWFSQFVEDPKEMSPDSKRHISSQASPRMATQLASHVHTNTDIMMSADSDRSGSVSWEEYLMEQAIYSLAVRPNIGPVKIKKKPSFCL